MSTGARLRFITAALVAALLAGCSVAGRPVAGPAPSAELSPTSAAPTSGTPDDIVVSLLAARPGDVPSESIFTATDLRIVLGEPILAAETGTPVAWMAPAVSQEQWEAALRAFPETGLWPVLVDGLEAGDLERPWRSGELDGPITAAGDNAGDLLPEWWESWTADDVDNYFELPARWPGLAEGSADGNTVTITIPGEIADELFGGESIAVLLVPVSRPADVVATLGWSAATNYLSPAEVSTVLRRWETLHGAVPVFLGFDILGLYVERPPSDPDEVIRTAAEHFSFAPDTIWQGEVESFPDYVDLINGSPWWTFWWD